jgi:serine phosphatase RsbU (regulator of sigma subunit)
MAAQERPEPETEPGSEGMRSRRNRLQRLNEFHRTLAGPISLEDLLELVLDRAFADLRPEEGVIFLRQPDGEYARATTRRLPGTTSEFLYSRRLIAEVTEKGLAALVYDVSADERFSASESIMSSGIRSLVAAPLLDPSGCPGMIVLSSRGHVKRFSEEDMEELVSLAAAAALRIRNIALAEEAAQRRVLEKELALARQIQMALLPTEQPDLPGYELFASNFPTRAVSGDLYQWQTRAEGRECVFLVADVSGKGMAASMLTASLEALAAGPIEGGMPPEEICTRLSRRLYARTSAERYATGFVAVLHPESGRFCYANAGHNAALLLRRSGEVEQLGATGLPLGLLPVGDYLRDERSLAPGDVVFIYTDGITEAANPQGEEYGLERVISLTRDLQDRSVNDLAAALDEDMREFVQGVPYADDRTLIILRRLP